MTIVIGIDPGPTTGIVAISGSKYDTEPPRLKHIVQCDPSTALILVRAVLGGVSDPTRIAVERFVVGRSSMRSGAAGVVTRDLIGALADFATQRPLAGTDTYWCSVVQRSASEVKPWATDERLAAAGLLTPTKGMGHARDAARHALFAAVKDVGMPDPLSRRAGAR